MTVPVSDDSLQQISALEAHIIATTYDDKQLDEAEKTLRRAFRATVQGAASPAAFFAGMYRTENKKLLDSKMPEYLIDPEYPGERRDRWATQVHLKATAPAHFSRAPVNEQGYLYQSVHAIVNSLPERYLVFIKAQYMPAGIRRGEFLERLLKAFWEGYQPKLTPRVNRAVVRIFAETIIASSGGGDKFVLASIRSKLSDNRDTWKRHYLPHWRGLQADYQDLRRRALGAFLAES